MRTPERVRLEFVKREKVIVSVWKEGSKLGYASRIGVAKQLLRSAPESIIVVLNSGGSGE